MTAQLKDHQIAQLVNRLRDIAVEHHGHQCLRELISQEVTQALAMTEPVQVFLVRDVAALLGASVPDVCRVLSHLGHGQRSTNMEITPDEALAVADHIRAAAATTERKLAATPDHNGAPVPASPADMQVYDKIAAGYWTERKGQPYPGYVQLAETLRRIQRNVSLSRDDQIALTQALAATELRKDERWLTQAVDAAMVEMKNIMPPLRRSECERLILAAASHMPATTERKGEPGQQTIGLPAFDDLDDEAIDEACAAGGLYRVDFMRAFNALRDWKPYYTSPQVPEDVQMDAERYRKIRQGSTWPCAFASHDAPEPLTGDDLDAAIDAAQEGE